MDQTDDIELETAQDDNDSDVAGWVMERVERWRRHRDQNYRADWDKFYTLWSGKWSPDVQQKQAERSKLIAPATQNAVDQTVSEMVEATFGRGMWFDISDDLTPQEQAIAEKLRDTLIDDFDRDRVSSAITDVYYNGAIFGTGIAKRIVQKGRVNRVYWEAIRPHNFVIDTSACTVEEALGCAHETTRPKHEIESKQADGEYRKGDLGDSAPMDSRKASTSDILDLSRGMETLEIDPEDGVYITEYHGLVPTEFFTPKPNKGNPDADLLEETAKANETATGYTEAIVVIANGSHLLKFERNPIMDDHGDPDRGFVAYQHHKRPNSFWGIGQPEKAYNSQSGLDAELRARMDALGLLTYPVVGADATRLPKNLNLKVSPGKVYMTNGRPSEIIEALKFGNLDPVSFQQSADFERMVQLATGAQDPAKAVNGQNSTATSTSMQSSAFIKRAKLTMQNVDSDFLDPLVRKSLFAYMAVAPQRYPHAADFTVNSTMSIMAREFEQAQMTNLLAIIPQESQAFPIVLKGIVENYSGPSKDQIVASIDQMGKPNPQQQQLQQITQQMALQKMQKEIQLLDAQIMEVQTRAGLNQAKGQSEVVKAHHSGQQLDIEAAQTLVSKVQAETAAKQVAVNAAKAHADTRINVHKAVTARIGAHNKGKPNANTNSSS